MNRIAIIDDSDINLMLLENLVGKLEGCEAVIFQESLEGLRWCAENLPDLVIVDYMMPELDGLEFITRFRRVPGREQLPVLMITANGDKAVRYQALHLGATDFLTKPVDGMEFSARVRNMLALNTSQRYLADRAAWLADEVAKATKTVHDREHELLLRMSRAAEFRDPETGAHIQRMAQFSHLIASRLGLPKVEQELIRQAAPMHDVGKIGIPDAILLKRARLTVDEFAIMKRHARLGSELLSGSESTVLQAAALIALTHHEKYDGSGYPQGLSGTDIPLFGRIVAVADVFDALLSDRSYKRAWPIDRALNFLRQEAGAHFDPDCVDAFLSSPDDLREIHTSFGETGT